MLLKDKVVIVSGIGPGLGTELALRAAEQGAKLVIAARTASKLDEAEATIAKLDLGTEVLKVSTDISDKSQCENLVNKTIEHFGRVDCLLNSAFNPGAMDMIERVDIDQWRSAFDVNLFGTMYLSQAVIPQMKKQFSEEGVGGAIVNVNTMVTRKPMATQAGYAASKAALTAATSHMAIELGRYKIRVNSAYMGWMWGASVKYHLHQQSKATGVELEKLKKGIEQNIALGEMPTDADCAKAAIFLASDYANAVTGACLDVNGGEFLPH